MRIISKALLFCSIPLLLLSCGKDKEKGETSQFQVPVEYYKLDNGLKVILSQDATAPTTVIAVYYNIDLLFNRLFFIESFTHTQYF